MIDAYPMPPNVTAIEQDRYTLDSYSFWRVGPDAIPTFDAPNTDPTGEIPAGFNFVNAIDLSVDGWIQIEGGQVDSPRRCDLLAGVLLHRRDA